MSERVLYLAVCLAGFFDTLLFEAASVGAALPFAFLAVLVLCRWPGDSALSGAGAAGRPTEAPSVRALLSFLRAAACFGLASAILQPLTALALAHAAGQAPAFDLLPRFAASVALWLAGLLLLAFGPGAGRLALVLSGAGLLFLGARLVVAWLPPGFEPPPVSRAALIASFLAGQIRGILFHLGPAAAVALIWTLRIAPEDGNGGSGGKFLAARGFAMLAAAVALRGLVAALARAGGDLLAQYRLAGDLIAGDWTRMGIGFPFISGRLLMLAAIICWLFAAMRPRHPSAFRVAALGLGCEAAAWLVPQLAMAVALWAGWRG